MYWNCYAWINFGSTITFAAFLPFRLRKLRTVFRSSPSFSRCCLLSPSSRSSTDPVSHELVPLRVVVFKVFGTSPEIPRRDPEKRWRRRISPMEFILAAKISYRARIFATSGRTSANDFAGRRDPFLLRRWQRNDATYFENAVSYPRGINSGIKFRCHLLNANKAARAARRYTMHRRANTQLRFSCEQRENNSKVKLNFPLYYPRQLLILWENERRSRKDFKKFVLSRRWIFRRILTFFCLSY